VNLPHPLFSSHFFSHPSPFSVPFFPLPSPSLLFPSTGVLPINPVREREHCKLSSGSGCRLPDKIVSCDCCVEKVVREKQSMGCRLYGILTVCGGDRSRSPADGVGAYGWAGCMDSYKLGVHGWKAGRTWLQLPILQRTHGRSTLHARTVGGLGSCIQRSAVTGALSTAEMRCLHSTVRVC